MNKVQKSYVIWGIFILGILALLFFLAKVGGNGGVNTNPNGGQPTGATLSDAIQPNDQVKGNPNASVVIYEYSDFQCPACASAFPVVAEVAAEYGDDIAVVYRHYPLRQAHPHAQLAGQASEAAGMQGKFWEMHDELFKSQRSWSTQSNPSDFFIELAEKLDLDTTQFETDMNSSAARDKVNADYSSGVASQVRGTPTFYINGEQITNPGSVAGWKQLIEPYLAAQNDNSRDADDEAGERESEI